MLRSSCAGRDFPEAAAEAEVFALGEREEGLGLETALLTRPQTAQP